MGFSSRAPAGSCSQQCSPPLDFARKSFGSRRQRLCCNGRRSAACRLLLMHNSTAGERQSYRSVRDSCVCRARGISVHASAPATCFKIRRAEQADLQKVAHLITEAFWIEVPGLRWLEQQQPFSLLRQQARANMTSATEKRLTELLQKKQEAAQDARTMRAEQEVEQLRAELQQLAGRKQRLLRQTSIMLAKSIARKSERQRMFACLVAEASCGIVGTVTLTTATPEALLPPPFPTTRPARMYLSSLAVADSHRRQGIASALLASSELLGRRWHQDTLWLHVDDNNAAAQHLYSGALYEMVGKDPLWFGPLRRRLLRKALIRPRLDKSNDVSGSKVDGIGGSQRTSDGVFVWDKQEQA